jgi:hypothetical protein
MDTASLAAVLVGAQAGSTQSVMAAKMLRMNADAEQAMAAMLEASSQNLSRLANVGDGIGDNLDISA